MAYSVNIAEAAVEDLRQAYFWYEEQQENLGASFEKCINKAFDSIRDNPLKTQIRYNEIRVFFLKKFPFGIHFKVSGKEIVIVAVFHTSRSPDELSNRS